MPLNIFFVANQNKGLDNLWCNSICILNEIILVIYPTHNYELDQIVFHYDLLEMEKEVFCFWQVCT